MDFDSEISYNAPANFNSTVDFNSTVEFTTGQLVRLKGKNFLSISPETTGGGTSADISGFTADNVKFNFADNVLYKTGFGILGYDTFDNSHSYFGRNVYVSGDEGINLYVNASLKSRFASSSITFYEDLTLESSDLTAVNITGTGLAGFFNITSTYLAVTTESSFSGITSFLGTSSFADTSTFNGLVKANSGLAVNNGVDGTSGQGIYMWHPADPEYSIYLSTAGEGKSITDGTAVSGHDFNGHSIRFREKIDVTTNSTGFIFENSAEQLLMSINATNKSAHFSGKVGVGASALNTLDVAGSVGIGATIAGGFSAPTNGLRVQGETHFGNLIKLQSYMTSELSTMTPSDGHLAYNTSTDKFVGYANGAWVDLN